MATPRVPFGSIAKPLLVLLAVAALAAVSAALLFPNHWRVVAVEQMLLTPWLRPGYLGDGGPATELVLCNPMGLALTGTGELLVSDRGRARRGRVIWRIDAGGTAHIVAGTGRNGRATASSALELSFSRPESMAMGADGSLFVSDGYNHAVFRIHPDRRVERVAGTGAAGFSGDGGPAARAMLHRPADIRLDRAGNLVIADVLNHRVRRVDASGRIATIAGTGERGFSPDGTPAAEARLDTPWGLAIDGRDRLLIADSGNHRIRRVEHDGRLVTIAGNGRRGFDGDGGKATAASLNAPEALFVDPSGRLFFGDELNHAVRVIDGEGRIATLIGTGTPGRAAIGARARGSQVDDPEGVLVTAGGELIVTDGNNGRVLRIAGDGIIRHVAGRGDVQRCVARW